MVTTYGSAETCGGCVYDGVPLEGVLVRVAEDGRILLGGATIAAGYLDAPETHGETFIEETAYAGTGPTTSANWTPTAGWPCSAGPTTSSSPAASRSPPRMSRRSWKSSTACARLLLPGCHLPNGARPWPLTWRWPTAPPEGLAAIAGRRLKRLGTSAGRTGTETVLAAAELLMLPNGKPDRLAMTVRLNALHQGK